MTSPASSLLAALPETFRYSDALTRINERQLRALVESGEITAIARGLYRKADSSGDDDLLEIAAKSSSATICLRSSLARHNLIDDIPAEYDIAVPRGSWTPETHAPVRWRHFDKATFELGRDLLALDDDHSIGIYSAERSIIDASACSTSTGRTSRTRRSSDGSTRAGSRPNSSRCRSRSRAL